MTYTVKKYADAIGMAASGICLVHCILMPFFLTLWLSAGHCTVESCLGDSPIHFDHIFLAFSALAVWLASGHCTKRWLKVLMWVSFVLLSAGILLEPLVHSAHGLTYPAAVGLLAAHFFNWRSCRHCNPKQP